MPPPKRWTRSSTTIPSPNAAPAAVRRRRSVPVARSSGPGPAPIMSRPRRGRRCRRARRRPRPTRAAGVADQDQPGVGPDRLDQPRHQRQRHHRGLVDDHDVVGQAVERGRGGSGCGCRAASRAAGAGSTRGGRAARSRIASSTGIARRLLVDRLLSRAAALPVGAASATSGGGAPAAAGLLASSATIRATVVVLPVPGPPAITAKRRQHRGRGGEPLALDRRRPANSRPRPVGEHGPGRPPAARSGARAPADRRRPGAPRASSGRDTARCRRSRSGRGRGASVLAAPATSALAATRPIHWPPAPARAASARSTGSSDSTIAVSRTVRQIDEARGRAAARARPGRRRAATASSSLAGQRAERARDVHVGRARARRPR